jgi:hypothetical protein
MKPLPFLLLAGLLAVSGCGNNQTSTSQTTNAAAPAAPAGDNYGSVLVNAQKLAVSVVDTSSLKQAIQLFNAQEGRNPKDLNELVSSHLIGQIPPAPHGKKFDYNPDTGEIKLVDQ